MIKSCIQPLAAATVSCLGLGLVLGVVEARQVITMVVVHFPHTLS